MNDRAVGVKVQIKDSAQNLVKETASIMVSSIAYLFAWHYRQFGAVINLDTHDDSWKDMIDLQNLVDGDHSPALVFADTAIFDLGEETEIDGFFIVGNRDAIGSKPSPQFFVEILDADQRQVLTTAPPVTSADGYLAEFNRAGVKSIDWRYITDGDVHINSDYNWSNLLDQSYDWTGISYPPPPPPPFPDRVALKTAVDNCLAVDPTGLTCCRLGADCGVAGTSETVSYTHLTLPTNREV